MELDWGNQWRQHNWGFSDNDSVWKWISSLFPWQPVETMIFRFRKERWLFGLCHLFNNFILLNAGKTHCSLIWLRQYKSNDFTYLMYESHDFACADFVTSSLSISIVPVKWTLTNWILKWHKKASPHCWLCWTLEWFRWLSREMHFKARRRMHDVAVCAPK